MGWEWLTADEILTRLIVAALSGLVFAYVGREVRSKRNEHR